MFHENYMILFLIDYCNRGYFKVPTSVKSGTITREFKLLHTYVGRKTDAEHTKAPAEGCTGITYGTGSQTESWSSFFSFQYITLLHITFLSHSNIFFSHALEMCSVNYFFGSRLYILKWTSAVCNLWTDSLTHSKEFRSSGAINSQRKRNIQRKSYFQEYYSRHYYYYKSCIRNKGEKISTLVPLPVFSVHSPMNYLNYVFFNLLNFMTTTKLPQSTKAGANLWEAEYWNQQM